jgi:copper chaperone CopZ
LKKTKGVRESIVNLEQNRATVIYAPSETSIQEIKQSVLDVGFQVGEVKEVVQ